MSVCLGLDTSNYTTSAAIWQDGAIHQVKRLLPVKPGELGLRQSDAVFHHVRQLPDIVEELRGLCDAPITAALRIFTALCPPTPRPNRSRC